MNKNINQIDKDISELVSTLSSIINFYTFLKINNYYSTIRYYELILIDNLRLSHHIVMNS